VRSSVGVLTEMHGLYGRMPAEEYLDFFGQLYRIERSVRKERIDKLLVDYGLYADRRRRTAEYSKGMRQKLALARALMHEPPVLLLDEPTSAMDPESARLVRDAIHLLRSSNRAIIICTHNLPEAEELADQIAIIRHGRESSSKELQPN
jgi:ABC-2 type transport system ATP-binding protein